MPISEISDILSDINSVFGPVKNIVEGFDKIFDWDGEKGALDGLSGLSTDLGGDTGDGGTGDGGTGDGGTGDGGTGGSD